MPTPEALAREKIDEFLVAAGWVVQDYRQLNLSAGRGIYSMLRGEDRAPIRHARIASDTQ